MSFNTYVSNGLPAFKHSYQRVQPTLNDKRLRQRHTLQSWFNSRCSMNRNTGSTSCHVISIDELSVETEDSQR